MVTSAAKQHFSFNLVPLATSPSTGIPTHRTGEELSNSRPDFSQQSACRPLNLGSPSASKRPGVAGVAPSAPKKSKTSEFNQTIHCTPLEIPKPMANVTVVDGDVYLDNFYSPKILTHTGAEKNKKARNIVLCLDTVLNRQQANVPKDVQEVIAGFTSLNPHISVEKIEMLLAIGKMNAIKAALTQKSETFLKKRSDAKKGRLVESKDNQELQYKSECTTGWDILQSCLAR
jgi:hypothetical protein